MEGMRLGATLALGCAFCLSFAACGGSGEDEFTEDYNAAVRPLSALNADAAGSIRKLRSQGDNEAVAREFQKLADKAQQTHDKLVELDPPDDARDAFSELLSSLQDGADDLRAVVAAARESDPKAADEAQGELETSARRILAAETALRRAVEG